MHYSKNKVNWFLKALNARHVAGYHYAKVVCNFFNPGCQWHYPQVHYLAISPWDFFCWGFKGVYRSESCTILRLGLPDQVTSGCCWPYWWSAADPPTVTGTSNSISSLSNLEVEFLFFAFHHAILCFHVRSSVQLMIANLRRKINKLK